jgi:RHS repeat-associated protein
VTVISNALPTVSLTSPTAGATFNVPATVTVTANAADADGTVTKVDFYDGTTLVGTATAAPFTVTLNNVAAGAHTYTAVATDNRGATATSAAVAVSVNAPPTVSITASAANAVFNAPASITVTASAADADGTIAKVDFYQGNTLIGIATASPYTIQWTNVAAGAYSLTAVATDDRNAATTSAAVAITVNALPTVAIIIPTAGATFTAPATITVTATAADADGTITKVDFYQGTTLIGTATASPYTISWTNVAAGSYSLTAIATDNLGGTATSAAVAITVSVARANYFIHTDHLNTPRLVADATGTTVWRWDQSEPFGVNVPDENPSGLGAFNLPLRLPGQYYDKESALHQNMSRDYDPSLGRYTRSDPLGLAAGPNNYSYVNSDPMSLIDPLGLWSTKAHNFFIGEFVREAMPQLAGQYGFIEKINEGSAFADSWRFQTAQMSYMHAMSSDGWDPLTARAMMCNFVAAYLGTYRRMVSSSNPSDRVLAYFYLGMALHPIMDSTSPLHRGFQYWPNGAQKHGGVDSSPMSHESLRHAGPYRNETVGLMREALQGNLAACGCR